MFARGVDNSAEKNRNLHVITANNREYQIHQAMPTVTPMMRENKSYKVSQIKDQASLKSNSSKKSKVINNSLIISRCQRQNLFSLLTSRESTSSSYKTIEFFQVAISLKIKKRRSSQKSSRMREAPIALIVIATIIKYKRRSKRYHSRLSSRRKPRSNNSRKIALKINNPTEDR